MPRAPVLAVLAALLTAAVIGAGTALVAPRGGSRTMAEVRGAPAPSLEASAAKPPAVATDMQPMDILRTWDARRAQAWARGDPSLLRPLYTSGSAAGRHDRAMLRSWTVRGLVVRGLRTQLFSVRALRHDASSWTLVVTDRLVGGVAVGNGVRRALPQDQATTRTVTLRLADSTWRVASVLPGEVSD